LSGNSLQGRRQTKWETGTKPRWEKGTVLLKSTKRWLKIGKEEKVGSIKASFAVQLS